MYFNYIIFTLRSHYFYLKFINIRQKAHLYKFLYTCKTVLIKKIYE